MTIHDVDALRLIFTLRELQMNLMTLVKGKFKYRVKQLFERAWNYNLALDMYVAKATQDLDRVHKLEEGSVEGILAEESEHILKFMVAYTKAKDKGARDGLMELIENYE